MNKTSPTVVVNPERSAYLHWINDGIAATREDQVGPAIALQVDKGDSLSLETWAKFEKKPSYTRNATTGMLADLLGSMFVNAAYGLETATQAKQVFNTNLSAALGGTGGDAATHPYAYLNYLVFDANYVVQDGGAWRVPSTAGFDPGMEADPSIHKLVKFPSHIKPQQKGYIYIWVSNESENTKVWFDDLKVTHTKSRVVQASDYYAWGSTMREQRTPENPTYKYGYQGKYAEKDLETGWNHFELREYDGVVGRWTVIDPARQHWSPYIGIGNNPISGVDQDGGVDGYYDGAGNYVWFDNQTSSSFTDDSGVTWNKVTDNYDAWNQAITIFEGNVKFLVDMGYDELRVRRDVQLLEGDHEFFTKYTKLNNSEKYINNSSWEDRYSITGTGSVKQSTFSNDGLSIKYYQNKGVHNDIHALGLVKSSFLEHSWEAGWEVLELIFFDDDSVGDMHFQNPFAYIKNSFVPLMMKHTEVGYKHGN